jgi:hypothetical protein
MGIDHRYCDPDQKERAALGIATDGEREQEWINRIAHDKECQIIFVCGDNHVKSFKNKLEEAGLSVAIDSEGWGNELAGEILIGESHAN